MSILRYLVILLWQIQMRNAEPNNILRMDIESKQLDYK